MTREPIEAKEGVEMYLVKLGEIGRSGDADAKTNEDIAKYIVELQVLLDEGHLKPLDYVQIGDVGVGEVLKALEVFNTHKSGKKIIVRLAEE